MFLENQSDRHQIWQIASQFVWFAVADLASFLEFPCFYVAFINISSELAYIFTSLSCGVHHIFKYAYPD